MSVGFVNGVLRNSQGILPLNDRGDDIGSTTLAFNDLFIDGISWDDGTSTLDDYEAGTWTPVFTTAGGTPPTSVTYGTQVGQYRKFGDMVQLWMDVRLSSKGSGGTGSIIFTGLPFTPLGTPAFHGSMSTSLQTYGASQTSISSAALSNPYLTTIESGSGVAFNNCTWANAVNTSIFIASVSYLV